jgi:hypothetical protein
LWYVCFFILRKGYCFDALSVCADTMVWGDLTEVGPGTSREFSWDVIRAKAITCGRQTEIFPCTSGSCGCAFIRLLICSSCGAEPARVQKKKGLAERLSGNWTAFLLDAQAASTAGEHMLWALPTSSAALNRQAIGQIEVASAQTGSPGQSLAGF